MKTMIFWKLMARIVDLLNSISELVEWIFEHWDETEAVIRMLLGWLMLS